VNERPVNEADPLRLILRALQDKRQNRGLATLAVQSQSQVTINLTDYKVTVRSELAFALSEVNPPEGMHLIRECPVCRWVFWAGRDDKKTCDKHAEKERKRKQRQNKKAEAKQQAAERKDAELKKALHGLSRTAIALLNAIVIGGKRTFNKIDFAAWKELDDDPSVQRVPPFRIVRNTLNMLVKRGYLDHVPKDDPDHDLYIPEPRIMKAWSEIRRERELATH